MQEQDTATGTGAADALTVEQGARFARAFDRRLLRLAMTEPRALLGTIALGLVVAGARVGSRILLAVAIARTIDGGSWGTVAPFVAGAVALVLVRAGATTVQGAAMAGASVRLTADLRIRLVRAVFRLGPGWVGRQRTGELEAVMVDGVEKLDAYFRLFLAKVVTAGITAVAVVAVVFAIDPVVGSVVGGLALVLMLLPSIEYRALGPRMRFWSTSYRPLAAEFVDNLQGMSTLKMFGVARHRAAELFRRSDDLCEAAIKLVNVSAIFWGGMAFIAGAGIAAGLTIGALRTSSGAMTSAQLLLVLLLVGECFTPAREIHDAMHLAVWGMSKVDRAYSVLSTAGPVTEVPSPAAAEGLEPSIELDDVRFRYDPSAEPALDGVSLSIRAGETVAIVGGSGAGKTTMASLLLRFFDPQEGAIRIGGRDVGSMSPDQVRAMIALVPQDTFLFHESIRDNLLLANPGASQGDLDRVARSSNADELVDRLPLGFDTVVGERGLRVSGGERQRIAIARALLKDAPILVLDEATSSVEVSSEARIHAALERLRRGRTTLVIAHRLSTVRGADRILVLDRGRLVEQGTHGELLERRGRYAQLVAAQAGG